MDNASMLSASDVALLTDRNMDGFGGNSMFYLFAILFLFGNGGFGGWGNNRGNFVTEADLCNANSFSELKNSVGRLNDNQAAIARQTDNAICQLGYQGAQQTYELGSKIDNCCCNTQLGIQGVKFDMANYASGLQIGQIEGTQKVLDKLCDMQRTIELGQRDQVIAEQAQRIAALEADARMCGIPRINPYAYGVYQYPTCSTGNVAVAY